MTDTVIKEHIYSAEMASIDMIDWLWEQAGDKIDAALKLDWRQNPGQVKSAILSGDAQFWVLFEDDRIGGYSITQITHYPSEVSAITVLVATGGINTFKGTVKFLHEFATLNNCTKIEFFGRDGWLKSGVFDRQEISHSSTYSIEVKA